MPSKHFKPSHIIIIPIEIYSREVDHKLLLAYYLSCHLNLPVVIAKDNLALKLALHYKSSSIYIGKNFYYTPDTTPHDFIDGQTVQNSDLMTLLANGVNVIFVDEEGGLYLDGSNSTKDRLSYRSRLPLNDSQRHEHFPNLTITHWGHYQASIGRTYFPHLKHVTIGAPFVDACKCYRLHLQSFPKFSAPPEKIGVLASSSLLNIRSFNSLPTYLAAAICSNRSSPDTCYNSLLAELNSAFIANSLSTNGFEVTYRPHPSSFGLTLSEWRRYCSRNGILFSDPVSETILSFLIRHSFTIHTAGCTTSLQSHYLGLPSIIYGAAEYGVSSRLVSEVRLLTVDDVVRATSSMPFAKLLPLANNIILDSGSTHLDSFSSICNITDSITSSTYPAYVSPYPLLSSFKEILAAELFSGLRGIQFWKTSKFNSFYHSDVVRNLEIARSLWPNSSVRVRSCASQYLTIY